MIQIYTQTCLPSLFCPDSGLTVRPFLACCWILSLPLKSVFSIGSLELLLVLGVMPLKGSRRGRSVAQMDKLLVARSRSISTNPGPSEPGDTGVEGEGNLLLKHSQSTQEEGSLKGAEQLRYADLLEALSLEKEHSMSLSEALEHKRKQSEDLSSKLDAERLHAQELYKSLHVEHCAHQRGNQRKAALQLTTCLRSKRQILS